MCMLMVVHWLLQLERQIMGAAAKTLQTSTNQVMDGYDLDLSDPDDLAFYTCILARAGGSRFVLDLTYGGYATNSR
jgi:hypothetical protein